jgi:hypothetical protein
MTVKQSIIACLIAFVGTGVATRARADIPETLDMTFASGATFTGTVDLANDYSSVTGVDGVLQGGTYVTQTIDWVWVPGTNYAGVVGDVFGTFLMSGTPGPGTPNSVGATWIDFVNFTYDYTDAPVITFAAAGDTCSISGGGPNPNCVDYTDPMVSGSISAATPEPAAVILLATMLLGVAFMARKRID